MSYCVRRRCATPCSRCWIAWLARRAGHALVVFSDGADRYSEASEADVLARARQSRALIYPIVIGEARPRLLAELAVLTGGRLFQASDAQTGRDAADDRLGVANAISARLCADGASRPVAVDRNRRPLQVRARDGYERE